MGSFLHFRLKDGKPRSSSEICRELAAAELSCEEFDGETFALGICGSTDTLYLNPGRDRVERVEWSSHSQLPRGWSGKIIDALDRAGFEYTDEDEYE